MSSSLPAVVTTQIRMEMARQRMSQQSLGQRVGLRQDQISRRLNGEIQITLVELERIAQALGLRVEHFLSTPERAA